MGGRALKYPRGIHLRKGASFSDGHPITAEDVLFSFEVVYDDALHPVMQEMLQVEGKNFTLSAPDPYTIVINTEKPHAGLLDALCPGSLPIIPKHVLQESYKNGTFASAYNVSSPPEKIVTSGAWRLGQHVTNEKTVLVRTPITGSIQKISGCHELDARDSVVPTRCGRSEFPAGGLTR